MQWYINKLKELEKKTPVISVCGGDCAVCPRHLASTEDELRETAEFWHKVGWRDHIVSNEEIRCSGCGSTPNCSFKLLACTKEHGVEWCPNCAFFECSKVKSTFEKSREKILRHGRRISNVHKGFL